ncbi:MAG TPA: HD-GYP domain-containing protein [Bryobacteraceae bacterium]|nr:HD-GYP domain-containing protein [Bryobacteraceae bacterium]
MLVAVFWAINVAAIETVRDGLRVEVRENQDAFARLEARSQDRERRILQGVAQNPTLKAGLELLAHENRHPEEARNTVQDQLSEVADSLKFDLVLVSSLNGNPLAGVLRQSRGFAPIDLSRIRTPQRGLFLEGSQVYEISSVPIFEGSEEVATLSVGEPFDIKRFGIPAVLLHEGVAMLSHATGVPLPQIGSALRACPFNAECQVTIQNRLFLSVPLGTASAGDGYEVRSLQNVDAASGRLQAVLKRIFLFAGLIALAAALSISIVASSSIARPLAKMASKLQKSSLTGDLPEFDQVTSGPHEILDLARGFDQAARAVRDGRERLTRAYVEFVGSLAEALDARDSYTAGHSRRVSEYSCNIARAMGLGEEDVETIRVGALLHDIGKIGISDLVLQKPGRLTPEENQVIQQHPTIGRRILENVHGFERYLPIIELHHENWDGTGYPHGLRGEATPLHARIVKVADAYDAMTSDRPYRRGMSHEAATAILRKVSGSETDSSVVEAFVQSSGRREEEAAPAESALTRLALAVQADGEVRERVEP